jgi:hypothetical protein
VALPWIFDEARPSYQFSRSANGGYPVVARIGEEKAERAWLSLNQLNGESISAIYGVQSWCQSLPGLNGLVKTEDGSVLTVGARSVKLSTGQIVYFVYSLRQAWRGQFSEAQFADFKEQASQKLMGNVTTSDFATKPAIYFSNQGGVALEINAQNNWSTSNPSGDLRGSPGCADQMNIQIR